MDGLALTQNDGKYWRKSLTEITTEMTMENDGAKQAYSPTIRELPQGERPRERLKEYGAKHLSNTEVGCHSASHRHARRERPIVVVAGSDAVRRAGWFGPEYHR